MYKPNEEIFDTFVEEDLETGLSSTDFEIVLLKDGSVSSISVDLQEITGANGFYRVEFTPDDFGLWSIDVVRTGKTTRYQQSYLVTSVADDLLDESVSTHLTPGTVGDYLNRVKKYATNKVDLDPQAGTYSVKEDDGVTEFEAGTATPTERTPN